MTVESMRSRTTAARSDVSGEYASTDRTVDVLLDLRNLAEGRPQLVSLIDDSLANLPGRNVVPNAWWMAQLNRFDQAITSPFNTDPTAPDSATAAEPVSR